MTTFRPESRGRPDSGEESDTPRCVRKQIDRFPLLEEPSSDRREGAAPPPVLPVGGSHREKLSFRRTEPRDGAIRSEDKKRTTTRTERTLDTWSERRLLGER